MKLNKKGFTMIEIVVDLALLGLLTLSAFLFASSVNGTALSVKNTQIAAAATLNTLEHMKHQLIVNQQLPLGIQTNTISYGTHDVTQRIDVTGGDKGIYKVEIVSRLKNQKTSLKKVEVVLVSGVNYD